MPSVAQITYFKASECYKSGSICLDGPLSQISRANGMRQSYIGYQVEDHSILFWVNDWATKDDQEAFVKQADYIKIENASRPAFGSEPTVNYVQFEDAQDALGAPFTEFVSVTLKEGKSMAELEALIEELHRELVGTPKFHGDSWAPVIGKSRVYYGILGWDSVEAHWDAVSDGRLKVLVDQVKLIADLWVAHAVLKPFSA